MKLLGIDGVRNILGQKSSPFNEPDLQDKFSQQIAIGKDFVRNIRENLANLIVHETTEPELKNTIELLTALEASVAVIVSTHNNLMQHYLWELRDATTENRMLRGELAVAKLSLEEEKKKNAPVQDVKVVQDTQDKKPETSSEGINWEEIAKQIMDLAPQYDWTISKPFHQHTRSGTLSGIDRYITEKLHDLAEGVIAVDYQPAFAYDRSVTEKIIKHVKSERELINNKIIFVDTLPELKKFSPLRETPLLPDPTQYLHSTSLEPVHSGKPYPQSIMKKGKKY